MDKGFLEVRIELCYFALVYWEILDPERQKLLPHLTFSKTYGFYLAGGTALALQLGHRTSIDFDFYSLEKFSEVQFEQDVVHHLQNVKVTQRGQGTLIAQAGIVDVSFFYYPYPLLKPLLQTEHLDVVSIPDIAAMKLIAISQRGLRRDFLDLYVISKDAGFHQIFQWASNKFPQFDPYVCLKGLTYFKEAEEDESGRGMMLKKEPSWSEIKNFFEKEAKRLAKVWL